MQIQYVQVLLFNSTAERRVEENDKRLYRAYSLKEHLRLLLKHKDTAEAEAELNAGFGGPVIAESLPLRNCTKRLKDNMKRPPRMNVKTWIYRVNCRCI